MIRLPNLWLTYLGCLAAAVLLVAVLLGGTAFAWDCKGHAHGHAAIQDLHSHDAGSAGHAGHRHEHAGGPADCCYSGCVAGLQFDARENMACSHHTPTSALAPAPIHSYEPDGPERPPRVTSA